MHQSVITLWPPVSCCVGLLPTSHVEAWTPLYRPRRKLMLKIWKHGRKYQKYVHVLLKSDKLTFEKQIDCNWKVWCIMNDAQISAYPGKPWGVYRPVKRDDVSSESWVYPGASSWTPYPGGYYLSWLCSMWSLSWMAELLALCWRAHPPIRESSFLPLLSAVSFCHLWKN